MIGAVVEGSRGESLWSIRREGPPSRQADRPRATYEILQRVPERTSYSSARSGSGKHVLLRTTGNALARH